MSDFGSKALALTFQFYSFSSKASVLNLVIILQAVGDALIWTLENAVGSPLDNSAKDAWGKLLTVVTENMKKGFLSDDGEK